MTRITVFTSKNMLVLSSSLAGLAMLMVGCGQKSAEETGEALAWACPSHDNCEQDFCDQTVIPAGDFTMGSDHGPHEDAYWPSGDERPSHLVSLDAFCIDTYEVSLDRYEACVDAGECTPNGADWERESAIETWVNHYPSECFNDVGKVNTECGVRAVNAKTYFQAEAYCEWIGASLCTEAQWERAANGPGPERRLHPWGDEDPTSDLVNLPSTGTGYVESVDSYHAGASYEGVLNMAGNVYEWVEDAYALYETGVDGQPIDNPNNPPTSDEDDGVGRGSCFFTEPEHTVAERSIFPLDFDWG